MHSSKPIEEGIRMAFELEVSLRTERHSALLSHEFHASRRHSAINRHVDVLQATTRPGSAYLKAQLRDGKADTPCRKFRCSRCAYEKEFF